MDRRRTPNVGKRHKNPKPLSPSSRDYSPNSHLPVTSVAGSQKQFDSKPVAEDLSGRDCQTSNMKNLTFNSRGLQLTHHSPVEMGSSERLGSLNSNTKKDFPSPSAIPNAKDKSLNVWGAERKKIVYPVEESYSPHTNTSCVVDSACIDESSLTTDFSIKNSLLEGIQCGKISQETTGLNDQSDISHNRYDICPPRTGPSFRLKAPLHVKNREIRNQNKHSMKENNILILRPGMILLKSYLSFNDQVNLVRTCRELGLGSGGFYQPGYSDGAKLNLMMMCLGKNWDPIASAYGDERSSDGAKAPPIPDEFSQLVKKAITDSHVHLKKQPGKRNVEDTLPPMTPNICIVNFYTKSGRLGLHQDKDETQESLRKGLPVVSFSIGHSADFVYGDQRDISNVETIRLESGDVLLFGGQARHIYHGVTAIDSDTASQALMEETNLRPGRLNLTFRQY